MSIIRNDELTRAKNGVLNLAIQSTSSFGPTYLDKPAGGIVLTPGMNVQAAVADAPTGATFWFESGTYHLGSPIVPKAGQTFIGEKDAVLDGGVLLDDIVRDGSYYVASGQTQQGSRFGTEFGADGFDRAGYPETVFVDGEPLTPVGNLGDLKPGHFFFDYGADEIVFAENMNGRVVEAGRSSAAFESKATDVTVSNFVIEHFNSPIQRGAIQGGEDWRVEKNEVRFNYGVGITVQDGGMMTGNDVHDNGQLGVGASGDGILVEGNEIADNGFWSGIEIDYEAGGSKFGEASNLVVRDNYAHNNHGYGLWTDENSIDVLYEGNLVVDNDAGGINHEISYDATIRGNTLLGNGAERADGWLWGSQVQIQNSQNVDIYDNRVDMSGGVNGIGLIQQDRGSGRYGEYVTTGNSVHDNVIVSRSGGGVTGGAADHDESGLLNGDNSFYDNAYYMSDGDHWWWGDFASGDDWDAYKADSGQGEGSTLSSSIPETSDWISATADDAPDVSELAPAPIASTVSAPSTGAPTPTIVGTGGPEEIVGTKGADVIDSGAGRDVLFADSGNDVLYGGAGADVFVFEITSGRDTIADFAAGGDAPDRVVLPDDFFSSAEAVLRTAHAVGDDVVIDYGSNSLTLKNVAVTDLSADLFSIA